VSSVDSGNLAGHLLTLAPGLLELADAPVFRTRVLQGLLDTIDLFDEALGGTGTSALEALRTHLRHALESPPDSTAPAVTVLLGARDMAQSLAQTRTAQDHDSDAHYWLDALLAQCDELVREAEAFALDPPEGDNVGFSGIPTLRQLARVEPLCWPAHDNAEGV